MNLKVSFSWIGLVIFALPMRHISPCRFNPFADICKAQAKHRDFDQVTLDVWTFNESAQKFMRQQAFSPIGAFGKAKLDKHRER